MIQNIGGVALRQYHCNYRLTISIGKSLCNVYGPTTGEAIIYRPPDVGFEAHAILITIPKLVQGPGRERYILSFTMNTSQKSWAKL